MSSSQELAKALGRVRDSPLRLMRLKESGEKLKQETFRRIEDQEIAQSRPSDL